MHLYRLETGPIGRLSLQLRSLQLRRYFVQLRANFRATSCNFYLGKLGHVGNFG